MTTVTTEDVARIVEGRTLATTFLDTVSRRGDCIALRERKGDDSWAEWTYDEYAAHVAGAAFHLRALGVEPGDRVVLMMRNSAAFHMIDLAVVFCGATAISIYNSSSPEQVEYLAGHCRAKLAIVEDDGFAERFAKVKDHLPSLRDVLNLAEPGAFETLFHSGTVDLQEGANLVTPETLATVIYTSGTTGPPKGVMLSNFNVMWTIESYRRCMGEDLDLSGLRVVSYLPMAHIAERMTSHYLGAYWGSEITCCPDPGQISLYLREAKPELVFGVPRVWEKLHAGLSAVLAGDPDQHAKFDAAVEMAKPVAMARSWGTSTAEQDALWDTLQQQGFASLRAAVGLDQVRYAVTGAAPIARELLEWFNAIGVPLSEIYGMSESTGPITWTPFKLKPGTVGPAIPGCEVALAEDGEIICRGGNVFEGYLDDPEKTADALDADGWLHTGDIGVVDEDGYYRVVDRKKELIITAGGKNISPANLESAMKTLPLVGQACAIGDGRPFVAALIVLDPEVAPVWAQSHGIDATSLADLASNPDVIAEIERGVKDVMQQFNNAERVKKVKVLSEEWLPDSEELTPTSKLKRRGIHAKYAAEIEALYR